MKIINKTLKIHTVAGRVSYHNITNEVKKILNLAGIEKGNVIVQSPHTTCSVVFEEYVHDTDFNGDEFLQVDLNRILDKIIPRELTEGMDYRYPGPKHEQFLYDIAKTHPEFPADPGTILNGDAHLRGSLLGASQTFIVNDGKMQIGSVGYIYFIDWDQNRERDRKCHVQIIGE